MSDAAQNVEIEDVLASIRRLVSDEVSQELARMAPLPRSESGRSVEDEDSPQEDTAPALVLTPALRVHTGGLGTPVEPAVNTEAQEAAAAPSEPYVLTQASLTDTAPAAQDDNGEAPQDTAHFTAEDAAETDTADSGSTDTDHEALLEAVAAHVAKAADAANRAAAEHVEEAHGIQELEHEDEAHLGASDDAAPEATSAEDGAPQKHAEHPEETEAAADESSEDVHDGPEAVADHDYDQAEDQTSADADGDDTEDAPQTVASEPEDEREAEYSEPDPHKAEATSLEAKIAKLESMIGARDETWEAESFETITPETHVIEDVVDTPLEWEDATVELAFASEQADLHDTGHASGHFETEPQPVAETASLEEGGEVFESQDLLIDEDMLRDVVSSIVREELKGALGERITRNVRKLVRREIHRALASHDLK